MKIEAYKSEFVPAGCHSVSLPFEILRKKYEITTFFTEAEYCTDITGWRQSQAADMEIKGSVSS